MSEKIVPRAQLTALGESLRREDRRVVLANGCFDLLHVGHVRYLQGARAEGDALIVAVNSDRGVQGLKGPGRPLLPENARAELVAALECVDYVVIFDGLTVEGVLRDLRPHVHCKGTDYTVESVPERAIMEELEGIVRIVGDAKNHSTHDILEQIRKRSDSTTSQK